MRRVRDDDGKPAYGPAILDALDNVTRSGDFCGGGTITEFPLPGLNVSGVGLIGMPLPPVQAEEIKHRCAPAPFGRKEKTIYDANVRDTWQLEPAQFQFTNPIWRTLLNVVLSNVQRELGCEGIHIECNIYKLLLYETGQHFARHRDTEKVDRMFATLVVSLPSVYTGGNIVVKLGQNERTFDHAAANKFQVCWAVFYADCEHEILPITSGFRLSIVYNVCFRGNVPPPIPQNAAEISCICKALKRWLADEDGPERLFYFIEHQYTEAGISFDNLKGRDRAVGQSLRQARIYCNFGFVLALVHRNWSGSAESLGGYRGHTDWGPGEEFASSTEVVHWVAPGMEAEIPESIGDEPDEEEEYLQEEYFEDGDPDSESVEEATGNEGATMNRQYRAAAFIFFKIEAKAIPQVPAVKASVKQQSNAKRARK